MIRLRSLLILLLLCPLQVWAGGLAFRIERLPSEVQASEAAVLSGAFDARFQPATLDALRDVRSSTWFRILPDADWKTTSPPILLVRQTRFQVITLYPNDGAPPTTLGALQRDYPASLSRGLMIFPLGDHLRANEPVYLRAHSDEGPTRLHPFVTIESRDAAEAAALTHVRLSSGAFAALMALALCALCVWLIVHEPLFLVFSALVAIQGMYLALIFGEAYSLPGTDWLLSMGNRAPNMFAALGAFTAILFARRMTDLKRIAPRLDLSLSYVQYLNIVLLLAIPVVPNSRVITLVVFGNLTIMLGTLLIIIAGAIAWLRGSRAAAFFMLAWLTMQGFTFARTSSYVMGIEPGLLVYYGFPLSMVGAGIMLALGLADRVREMRSALHTAQQSAQTDALTGLLNRRSIMESLDAARIAFREKREAVSVLFVDLDHFKQINDTHGHLAGDACLREVSRRLLATLRHSDAVGRYGGEEFLAVLRGADPRTAAAIAEQFRIRIATRPVVFEGHEITITCSIGIACSGSDELSAEDLIARSDAALYAAKGEGRNRIAVAPESSLLSPNPVVAQGEPDVSACPEPSPRTPR